MLTVYELLRDLIGCATLGLSAHIWWVGSSPYINTNHTISPPYFITTITHITITSAYHNHYHIITIPHYKHTILLTNHHHHISPLPYLTVTYTAPFHIAIMSDYHRITSHYTPYPHHTITSSTTPYYISPSHPHIIINNGISSPYHITNTPYC